MTTVVWQAASGTLAADTRIRVKPDGGKEHTQPGPGVRKVYRVRGHLLGFAGDVAACARWLEWFRRGGVGRRPSLRDIDVIRVRPDGRAHLLRFKRRPLPVMEHVAIGSGGKYAAAAIMAGASPIKAVRIAAHFDSGTGGRIQCLRLKKQVT